MLEREPIDDSFKNLFDFQYYRVFIPMDKDFFQAGKAIKPLYSKGDSHSPLVLPGVIRKSKRQTL